jgi:hypothetical protein
MKRGVCIGYYAEVEVGDRRMSRFLGSGTPVSAIFVLCFFEAHIVLK